MTASKRNAEEDLVERLDSIPDLRGSPTTSPQIVEISATVAEIVANDLNNSEELFAKADSVALANIAGAGFEPATFGL